MTCSRSLRCAFVVDPEAKPVLVDPSETRWQAVEPEQLPHRHDPGTWRRGGNPGTHPVQGHLFPHLGGTVLGEGQWLRGEHEVQETHQCPEGRFEPDPQPTVHPLVVAHYQQSKCEFSETKQPCNPELFVTSTVNSS